MADEVRLIIDGAAMQHMLRSPEGPVMRSVTRAADEIIVGARKYINARRRYPGTATHRLERTIVKRPTVGPTGPAMTVVAGIGLKPNYALWVHEGNAPAGTFIVPKKKQYLAFVTAGARPTSPAGWASARAGGTAVVVRAVKASRPNPFLRDAMEDVIRVRFRPL